jgi:hypothetical protein
MSGHPLVEVVNARSVPFHLLRAFVLLSEAFRPEFVRSAMQNAQCRGQELAVWCLRLA